MSHVNGWSWSTQLESHLANIDDHCPSNGGDKDQCVTWLSGSDTLKLNHKGYSKSNENPITKIYMYYKLRWACVKNSGSFVLLQIRANVATNLGSFIITNWGTYYKWGQPLLQNRAGITNWSKSYYKLGQVLQIRAIITNCCLADQEKAFDKVDLNFLFKIMEKMGIAQIFTNFIKILYKYNTFTITNNGCFSSPIQIQCNCLFDPTGFKHRGTRWIYWYVPKSMYKFYQIPL